MYDVYEIRKDFPVLEKVIYLDSGATTQTPKPAVEAMNDFFYNYAANYGRGAHRLSIEATNAFEDARETVADFLNAPPEKMIMTKNTTDSINIVANGFGFESGDHIITTLAEHHSNFVPWLKQKEKGNGVLVSAAEIDSEGFVDPEKIEEMITDQTKMIAVGHISNVFGSVQNVDKIIRIAHKNNIPVLVDGAQSAGHMELDLKALDCDYFAAAGHKGLLGPQGTGLLYIKDPETVQPTVLGGGTTSDADACGFATKGSPECFEAGTPNLPGVIGLGAAVEYLQKLGVKNVEAHDNQLARDAAKRLSEIKGVEIYGPENRAGLVSFNVEGLEPHTAAMRLDKFNICVRSGYHCAIPGMKALGINGSSRASFALYNTEEEVDALVNAVSEISGHN
ncbi:Cysteine desulfurase SufS [Methanimicrococcus sp. At1]|uniref:cysteine desulfurase n=1 Tax=Methanimicrococcus hacksteinii TaxID=3028293 RepID=A0ABU3VNF9_9EURY|nr:cysteine desulfurase [Methanimicrococcus sp. At1]MDV0444896.1 Cysteine desulfurase SufS [Methanimicrococcus sp. At1]